MKGGEGNLPTQKDTKGNGHCQDTKGAYNMEIVLDLVQVALNVAIILLLVRRKRGDGE